MIKTTALTLGAISVLASLAIAPVAVARRGADDPVGHVRQCRGCDDAPGHIRQGRGADDALGDQRRGRGRDEAPGDDRGAR